MYGEGAVTDQTCQNWFEKFRAGDFSLDDAPRSGRLAEVDSDQIKTLIENNQRYTTREIAHILKIFKSSVENHFHQLGHVNCYDVWVPHKLSEKTFLTGFPHMILYLNVMKTFFFFWLRWVFVVACGLSLVAASGGYSSLRCVGFSLQWLLLLWSIGSRCMGFSSCSRRPSVAAARGLSSCGARAQ